jgi:pimeloyl-ACP methyl ester carboxylesterase
MQDIIILIPGILGSTLQKDGRDLYPPLRNGDTTRGFVWDLLRRKPLHSLMLDGDDYRLNSLEDGITANRLVHEDDIVIPGFNFRILREFTYTRLSDYLIDELELKKGDINNQQPANYFEFPYDWRRDNRAIASQLEALVNEKLNLWRSAEAKNAKAILIAHSMGGLIARQYIEVLGGWQNCRALITFGTPYRGSVKALDYLGHDSKVSRLFAPTREVIRSLTSVYQLLPIYKSVKIHEGYQPLSEIDNLPKTIDKVRVLDALKFHRDIESAQKHNAKDDLYGKEFQTIPFVGTESKTHQSANWLGEGLMGSYELPAEISKERGGGDGTVPRVSATPIEFDTTPGLRSRTRYVIAPHATIQSHTSVMRDIVEFIRDLELPSEKPVRGDLGEAGIILELDDVYLKDESVTIRAEIKGNLSIELFNGLLMKAVVRNVEGHSEPRTVLFEKREEDWYLSIDDLEPGLYRVEVSAQRDSGILKPVRELFAVIL